MTGTLRVCVLCIPRLYAQYQHKSIRVGSASNWPLRRFETLSDPLTLLQPKIALKAF